MSLPYETATSGKRAIDEIQRILEAFGCGCFGHMMDFNEQTLLIQFEYRGRQVSVKASAKGYAAAWLREHPYTYRMKSTREKHEEKALKIGNVAIYSIARDWIKGQITAIETGVLSIEGAFLGQIMLEDGRTVLDHVADKNILKLENKG